MRNTDFKKSLKNSLHQTTPVTNQEHLEHTLSLAKEEVSLRYKRKRISFTQLLSKQIKFIGWKVLLLQGMLLLLLSGMMESIYGPFFWERPIYMMRLLFCLSVTIAMSAMPFIYRIARYQMHEIEAATYFSSVRLLMAKLTVIGIGDIILLTGIFCVTVSQTPMQIGNASLYLCLPFLLVSSIGLFMVGHFPAKLFFAGSMTLCLVLICTAVSVPVQFYLFLNQLSSIGRLAVCVMLIAFCIGQCNHILRRCRYAEMQVSY